MDELMERIENAEAGSRELDMMIAVACYSETEAWAEGWCHSLKQMRNGKAVCPRFTTSIDAAMTLVPEGLWWRLTKTGSGVAASFVEEGKGTVGFCQAETLALALCAAALGARKETNNGQ